MRQQPLRFRDPYLHALRRLFVRSLAQQRFRGQDYVSWSEFQQLWTPELFQRQGRDTTDIVVSKIDYTKPYSAQNICLTTRSQALRCQKYFQSYGWPIGIDPTYIIRTIP